MAGGKMRTAASLTAGLALAVTLAGCRVHEDKGISGDEKNVQVDTPLGSVHVNTDQTTAADLGLPVYPGAVTEKSNDNHNSADVRLGFGEWQMRVRAISYITSTTSDSKEQVVAFYKKALSRYGDVITCQGNSPVGTPTTTAEGLTCAVGKKNPDLQIDQKTLDYRAGKNGLELKAGSRRHQHIVGFEEPKDGKTRFSLVALDLPASKESGKSD